MSGAYATIRIEHEDALSWIVLDRPEAANALSPQLLDEFADALARLKQEGGPVIAIRGEGKGFCAGMVRMVYHARIHRQHTQRPAVPGISGA